MDQNTNRKKCSKCNIVKDFSEFLKDKECPNGITGRCKICQAKYQSEWKKKHKNRLIEKRVSLYHNDIGKSGKTFMLQRYKDYQEKNPIRERARRAKGSMNRASIKNNLPFDKEYFSISRLESTLKESTNCPCCGVGFVYNWGIKRKPEPKSPSFDKFIPQLGYVKGNVFLICWRCNNLKRDATEEELFRIVEWMVKTRSGLQLKEYK